MLVRSGSNKSQLWFLNTCLGNPIARETWGNTCLGNQIDSHIKKSRDYIIWLLINGRTIGPLDHNQRFTDYIKWLFINGWTIGPLDQNQRFSDYVKWPFINGWTTLFKDNSLSQFYFPGLFPLFLIHTWWGQPKYVQQFEYSRGILEKIKILHILKKILWILCIKHAKL